MDFGGIEAGRILNSGSGAGNREDKMEHIIISGAELTKLRQGDCEEAGSVGYDSEISVWSM